MACSLQSQCGLGGSLFLQLSGLEMIATLGGAELSNPFYKVICLGRVPVTKSAYFLLKMASM